jgi:hypothetical protein
LIAASLVLVLGMSAMIAVRGFHGVQAAPAPQSVVLSAPAERESGAARVVLGSGQARPASRRARARAAARQTAATPVATAPTKVSKPSRSGLSAPAPAPSAATGQGEVSEDAPAVSSEPAVAPSVTAPVDEVLDDVTGAIEDAKPAEKLGGALLDLRDALP